MYLSLCFDDIGGLQFRVSERLSRRVDLTINISVQLVSLMVTVYFSNFFPFGRVFWRHFPQDPVRDNNS